MNDEEKEKDEGETKKVEDGDDIDDD